jgi:hypothetical protein
MSPDMVVLKHAFVVIADGHRHVSLKKVGA